MEGIERLENETLELDNDSITKIFNYLKTRIDLYERFKNQEKSMDQMYDYIYDKAKKHEHKRMAMIDDPVVYLWAVTYFSKTNKELGIEEKKVMPPSATEVIQKIEREEKQQEEIKKQEDTQISMFQEVQE